MNYEALGFKPSASTVKLYTKRLGPAQDYISYLFDKPVKTDNLNEGTLLDFALVPDMAGNLEANRPHRGDYIILETKTYGVWFTGFITNEPELSDYLGGHGGSPVWVYKYNATSDDILLSQQPLGLMTPYLNTTGGAIIRSLAEKLAPGRFDLSAVQDGLRVARYVIDPKKTFAEVAKELSDTANFRFYSKNMQLFYEPLDYRDAAFHIDGKDPFFTPSNLKFTQTKDQIINDAIVLGDIEPQGFMNEYYLSDGETATYPLITSVYGVDSAILLDETFGGSQIDESKWSINDTINNYIQAANGYLNFMGGNQAGTLDAWIQSAQLIPLEGNLRITHGEWDFLSNPRAGVHGIIGGLWTNSPAGVDVSGRGSGGGSSCLFGIGVEYLSPENRYLMYAIVNGAFDPVAGVLDINTNWRYVIRTVATFRNVFRQSQQYSYISQGGAVTPVGGSSIGDVVEFSTVITSIDPTTGNVTGQTRWKSVMNLSDSTSFAYYVPAAMNDLHASVTNITISTPLQASMETLAPGAATSAWTRQIVGPNEIDSYDGVTPLATIVTSNSGVTTRSSYLGSPKYNAGNATLQFFKDTTRQTTTIPPKGSLIHLSYRRAGAAMARVVDEDSILAESTQWGDNGHRSVTTTDLQPKPRTSAECELAAAAIVNEGKRVHYEGDYTTYSMFINGEPVAGTILKFVNLPTSVFGTPAQLPIPPHGTGEFTQPPPDPVTGLPTGDPVEIIDPGDPNTYNFYEQINEVTSTLLCGKNASETFEHQIKFGKPDRVKKLVTNFNKQTDVFAPEDSAEVPDAIDASVLGSWNVDNITSPMYTGYDANYLYFDAGQDLSVDGGYEVRYTDDGWGVDDGKNLISRSSSRIWRVPRTSRGRICFVRAYDNRNQAVRSEDLTNTVWTTNGSVQRQLVTMTNIDSKRSLVTALTMAPNAYIYQTFPSLQVAQQFVASMDVFGADGLSVRLLLATSAGNVIGQADYITRGFWQRLPVAGAGDDTMTGSVRVQIVNSSAVNQTIFVTRVQLEMGRDTETIYCKTLDAPHGAYSRFSAGLHVKLPLKPFPPTITVDRANVAAPVVTINLPDIAEDVWGIELRAVDNAQVLLHSDLVSENYTNVWVHAGNTSRLQTFYAYTYNMLGEYSDAYFFTTSIPQPQAKNLHVDDSDKTLKWDALGAKGALVEGWVTTPNPTAPVVAYRATGQSQALPDIAFFPKLQFNVLPFDDLGLGIMSSVIHEYIPNNLVSFDQDEIASVASPPAPAVLPTPPPAFAPREEIYRREVVRNYSVNRVAMNLE